MQHKAVKCWVQKLLPAAALLMIVCSTSTTRNIFLPCHIVCKAHQLAFQTTSKCTFFLSGNDTRSSADNTVLTRHDKNKDGCLVPVGPSRWRCNRWLIYGALILLRLKLLHRQVPCLIESWWRQFWGMWQGCWGCPGQRSSHVCLKPSDFVFHFSQLSCMAQPHQALANIQSSSLTDVS